MNGKKNGKGKEYDIYSELRYEGEYLYGERLKGKDYNYFDEVFEGEYLFGKRFKGTLYKYGKVSLENFYIIINIME